MDNNFETLEKYPGERYEREVAPDQDFEKAFQEGVPEFNSEKLFGTANEDNEFYGEANDEEESSNDNAASEGRDEAEEFRNQDIAEAASILNYGLNAASREIGIEKVVQGIKDFDLTGSDDPIKDLYEHLGIDTDKERSDMREEAMASKTSEIEYQSGVNRSAITEKSKIGAVKAIEEMKELISLVESEDPRYNDLRSGAKSAGLGVFEYAVKNMAVKGLTDLFHVLSKQVEKANEKAEAEEEIEELVDKKVEEALEDNGTLGSNTQDARTVEQIRNDQLGNNPVGQVNSSRGAEGDPVGQVRLDKAKEDEIVNFIQNRIDDNTMNDASVEKIVKNALENNENVELLNRDMESESPSENEN